MFEETPPDNAALRKVYERRQADVAAASRIPAAPKCDVCHDGVISCAEGGMIVKKVCVFCKGRG